MQCEDCKYYQPIQPATDDCDGPSEGHCRRYPPKIIAGPDMMETQFPHVRSDLDWCGEFQAVGPAAYQYRRLKQTAAD